MATKRGIACSSKKGSVDRAEAKRHATRFRSWLIVISLIVSDAVLTAVVAITIDHQSVENASEIIELVRQISSVMKKEASGIHDISAFSADEQVRLRHEEFAPRLAQEHGLRERLAFAGQKMASESTAQ